VHGLLCIGSEYCRPQLLQQQPVHQAIAEKVHDACDQTAKENSLYVHVSILFA